MKWRGISFKLFAATSLVFIGCLTVMMFLQLAFFEPYYVRDKTNSFLRDFEQSRNRFLSENPGRNTVPNYFAELEEQYYAVTAVMTITNNEVMISAGKGIGGRDKQLLIRYRLPMDIKPDTLPSIPAFPDAERDKLLTGVQQWFKKPGEMDKVLKHYQKATFFTDVSLSAGPNNRVFVVVAPLQVKNGQGTIMIGVSSLQPVGDAVNAFQGFYSYFYLLAAAGALLLVLLYSRMITRPLRALNKTAQRMAKLDFRQKSGIRRNDEIGSLSDTLNFLSENLDKALSDLQKANVKLQEDIEQEKRLDRLRREFVAGVSHELKTPISLIGGYAEALQDNVDDGKKRDRYAAIIRQETSRMAGIVNDMLDLSQMETGQYRLQLDEFRLDEAVHYIAGNLQEYAGSGGKTIELELLPVAVHADRFRIEQVITNLLSNALRHTRDGGRLGIKMEQDSKEIRTIVWNEGERIPEEELAHLWDHFYRVEKSRERDSGGTGIGLAIVRQIMQLHGGQFAVRNTEEGVEFSFSLRTE
ncbi:HAMP domain-containing protein [Paenibacillus sp. H1-7]|uniref:sensor histidine kinase n=1 Tax=Paenibacillus sp. H1-7 TaxID=2282849 RepID=UPI001EF97FEF|nr:HAMP domain-containing sensor histidine kinase [Paenibacillus sp. H1-7]ULL15976.1 HAMP domain-containing protein [Paenibacillus sp. H1-7]